MYVSRVVTMVNVLGDIIIAGIVNDWSKEELRKSDLRSEELRRESRQYSRATSRSSTRRNNAAAVNV